jgi:hypothetical protein
MRFIAVFMRFIGFMLPKETKFVIFVTAKKNALPGKENQP